MKYTECRWHKYPDCKPIQDGTYVIKRKDAGIHTADWSHGMWMWICEVEFWSEIPLGPTIEELDREEYKKYQHGGSPMFYFLEGCKSARERMKK